MSPPAGSSTLITSAPSAARTSVQNGPARARVMSMTRRPASGPSAASSPAPVPAAVPPADRDSAGRASAGMVPPFRGGQRPLLDEPRDDRLQSVLVPGPAVDVVRGGRQHRDASG